MIFYLLGTSNLLFSEAKLLTSNTVGLKYEKKNPLFPVILQISQAPVGYAF